MSALNRRCCHVQPEAEKNKKGSRGKKIRQVATEKTKDKSQSGWWKEANERDQRMLPCPTAETSALQC